MERICDCCGDIIEHEEPFAIDGKMTYHMRCYVEHHDIRCAKSGKMTFARREEIVSKEFISTAEFQELTGLPYQSATTMMRNIKVRMKAIGKLREVPSGYIHTQDYLDYFSIPSNERWISRIGSKNYPKVDITQEDKQERKFYAGVMR